MDNEKIRALSAAIQKGDRSAFETLYQELKTPVFTIIYRILYDRELSEDVMQEVFLRIYRSAPDASVKNPRAFIFRMARNLAIDHKRKPVQSCLPDDMESGTTSVEDTVATRLGIDKALAMLDGNSRDIVTLHVNGGLKFREIAEIMDIPLGTVLWKYQKAIGSLRTELSGGVL